MNVNIPSLRLFELKNWFDSFALLQGFRVLFELMLLNVKGLAAIMYNMLIYISLKRIYYIIATCKCNYVCMCCSHRRRSAQHPEQPGAAAGWRHRPGRLSDMATPNLTATTTATTRVFTNRGDTGNPVSVACDGSHSFWWSGREWSWSRKQSRLTSHGAQAGTSRGRAGWRVKVFIFTLSVADTFTELEFLAIMRFKGRIRRSLVFLWGGKKRKTTRRKSLSWLAVCVCSSN